MSMNQRSGTPKEQINSLYLVRALAILGVISVHVFSYPVSQITDKGSTLFVLFNFLNVFHKFGTPTFLFLSAFVLFYSYYDRPLGAKLLKGFYKRRLLYILLPYLIVSAGYYLLFSEQAAFSDFLNKLLTGKSFYHLYFIFISLQFYLLFPLLLWWFQQKPGVAKHLIWIGLLLQWGFIFYNQYSLHYAEKGQLAISYFSNYFLGAYCGIHYYKIKEWLTDAGKRVSSGKAVRIALLWLVWLAAALSHVALWYWTRTSGQWAPALVYEALWFLHTYPSALVLLTAAHFLYRKLHPILVNLLMHLGVASFGVYIVHAGFIVFYFDHVSTGYGPLEYVLYVSIGYVFTLLLSWGVVGVTQNYFKLSWVLFGSAPKTSPYLPLHGRKPLEEKAPAADLPA